MYQKFTGVILKKYPFGEADEILTIYTKEAGKLVTKAVSSRKIKSKLAGALQSLNEIDFETAGGKNIPVLISVRTRTVNNYLRQNLRKFAHALIGIETLYRLTADRQEHEGVYGSLLNFLRNLEKSTSENLEVRLFQVELLKLLGFGFDAGGSGLNEADRMILDEMIAGRRPLRISCALEKAVEGFLDSVLEREIKSRKFLNQLSNSTT